MALFELSKHFVFAGLFGRQVEAKQFNDIMRAQWRRSVAMSELLLQGKEHRQSDQSHMLMPALPAMIWPGKSRHEMLLPKG